MQCSLTISRHPWELCGKEVFSALPRYPHTHFVKTAEPSKVVVSRSFSREDESCSDQQIHTDHPNPTARGSACFFF